MPVVVTYVPARHGPSSSMQDVTWVLLPILMAIVSITLAVWSPAFDSASMETETVLLKGP